MITPGSKGWINKYFDSVEKGEIVLTTDRPEGERKLNFMHSIFAKTGIVYGFALEFIFAKNIDSSDWTAEEKLKFLLFEAHLFTFQQIKKDEKFDRLNFLENLCSFYEGHSVSSISKLFKLFGKISEEEKLENTLAKRVDIKLNLLENKWWVNSLSNAFCFLDLILFDDFVHKERAEALESYDRFATNAMLAVILSAHSDGIIEGQERSIFNVFLASANLEDEKRDELKEKFEKGATMEDFSYFVKSHWLLKRFLLDISILTAISNDVLLDDELDFLIELCNYLDIPSEELEENIVLTESFLLNSENKIEFIKDSTSYKKAYSSLSKRWTKIIYRNKEKLSVELKQSKELLFLVKKSTSKELTKEEKEMVKTQFKDIAKSVPALAIFLLPGGALLLPMVLKIVPDLVPSAFRENEVDEETG